MNLLLEELIWKFLKRICLKKIGFENEIGYSAKYKKFKKK